MGAKWQVIGNFSVGQISFLTKKEAISWAKIKRRKGYRARVSKIIRTISVGERKRFEKHKKNVITYLKKRRGRK